MDVGKLYLKSMVARKFSGKIIHGLVVIVTYLGIDTLSYLNATVTYTHRSIAMEDREQYSTFREHLFGVCHGNDRQAFLPPTICLKKKHIRIQRP